MVGGQPDLELCIVCSSELLLSVSRGAAVLAASGYGKGNSDWCSCSTQHHRTYVTERVHVLITDVNVWPALGVCSICAALLAKLDHWNLA